MAIKKTDGDSVPQAQPERQATLGGEAKAFQKDFAARRQSIASERGVRVASAKADAALRLALPRMTVGTAVKFGLRSLMGTASAPLAAAQTLLVPSNSSHLREGTLPGHPGIGYSYKMSENSIEFFRQGADGTRNVLWSGSREGIQVDARGVPRINVNTLTAIAPDGSWNRQWEKFPADQKSAAVGGGYRAHELPVDTTVLESRKNVAGTKDGGKTGRKQPKNVDELKESLDVEQRTLRGLKSRPNKSPGDKEAIDRQQRLINNLKDRIKTSEPHAIKGQ
jgi:hypothetical protein